MPGVVAATGCGWDCGPATFTWSASTPTGRRMRGRVVLAERLGRNIELTVDLGGAQLIVLTSGRRRRRGGRTGRNDGRRHRRPCLRRGRAVTPRGWDQSTASLPWRQHREPDCEKPTTAQSLTLSELGQDVLVAGAGERRRGQGHRLAIEPGELVALLGPSGCGKTTTLRMIAGLETVTSGSIRIGDREVSQLPASKRGIGVGFESYALYPPLSVRENLLYGLKARKVKGADAMVASISSRLEMDDMLDAAACGAVQRTEAAGGAGPRAGTQPAGTAARRTAVASRRVGTPAGAP